MIAEAELLFQLGAIMLLAFVAATIAGRVSQSVMIGYIVIGVLIGPKISLDFLGFEYHGLISDTSLIELLSFVGLIMLMFFVGLEFSFSKLKKTKTPAIILAVIDTSVGLFVGFVFASYLGWPLIDSIFLAGVVAMSSTSIAMKILFDLKRMSSPEVEFLIGLVVVETFIAMLILTVASGMIVRPDANAWEFGQLLVALAAFYGFFIWVAMVMVPKVVAFFNSIENDEMFVLFVLGIVFLTSGVAQLLNVPPIIGAFFIGMILAESKVSTRIQSKLESFKDAFVAIFFTSFGMMIDPAMFGSVIWIVMLAIPIVILYEAFVMSAISYFMGFSSKASTTIGTSMCGRGVESILYASVGSNVQGATMGAQLNPFAGAFCFGMSAITPALVKHSSKMANLMSRLVPRSLKFSATVISRTLGKVVIPSTVKLFRGAKFTGELLIAFAIICVSILLSQSLLHMVLILVGVAITGMLAYVVRSEISEIARHVNYANIGVSANDRRPVVNLVSGVVLGAVVAALFIVSTWGYMWQVSLIAALTYVAAVVLMMKRAYGTLYSEGSDSPQKVFNFPRPPRVEDQSDDILPDVPMPVYNIVSAAPAQGEVRL